MFKVLTVLTAGAFIGSMAHANVKLRTETRVKTETQTQVQKPTTGNGTVAQTSKKTFSAATCNATEFASELARRGKGDSARIERQMKLVGLGLGACSADKGGLLGKDPANGQPNYSDAQLETLVKILNATEEALAKGMSMIEAQEAGYAAVTGADAALAKKAVDAFRNHCKIFASNN